MFVAPVLFVIHSALSGLSMVALNLFWFSRHRTEWLHRLSFVQLALRDRENSLASVLDRRGRLLLSLLLLVPLFDHETEFENGRA